MRTHSTNFDRPSRTAQFIALFRALESGQPPGTRLFEDPFAYGFLPFLFRCVVRLSRVRVLRPAVLGTIDWGWPGPRGAAIVRTRFIDDALREALRNGVDQIVILGAGFDCRAYRITGIERARVFEVDHGTTQRWKQDHLRQTLGALPPHVVYIEIDLNRQRLHDVLVAAGFRANARSFFILEGILNYLTPETIDAIFRFVAKAAAGSRVVATYLDRGILDGSARFEGARESMSIVRRSGEPFVFGFDPSEVPAYLAARGLELIEDLGATEYRARYLKPLGRDDKVAEFYRAALSEVASLAG